MDLGDTRSQGSKGPEDSRHSAQESVDRAVDGYGHVDGPVEMPGEAGSVLLSARVIPGLRVARQLRVEPQVTAERQGAGDVSFTRERGQNSPAGKGSHTSSPLRGEETGSHCFPYPDHGRQHWRLGHFLCEEKEVCPPEVPSQWGTLLLFPSWLGKYAEVCF